MSTMDIRVQDLKSIIPQKATKIFNLVIPVIGIVLMSVYEVCDTSCSYLRGSFLGIDLKIVGVLFMAVLLSMNLPLLRRIDPWIDRSRTVLLAGALGGEALLVHFQIVNNTYCPFCIAFGLCILGLFGMNAPGMNRYIAIISFIAGISTFYVFFQGSVLPQFS